MEKAPGRAKCSEGAFTTHQIGPLANLGWLHLALVRRCLNLFRSDISLGRSLSPPVWSLKAVSDLDLPERRRARLEGREPRTPTIGRESSAVRGRSAVEARGARASWLLGAPSHPADDGRWWAVAYYILHLRQSIPPVRINHRYGACEGDSL